MSKSNWQRIILLMMTGFIFLVGCTPRAAEKKVEDKELSIVTSFYPMYALTKEISGDLNDVRMINSVNGIHSYEPSAADVKAIAEADIFIYHSRTLESWTQNLKQNFEDSTVEIIEASDGLDMQRVQGLEEIELGEGMDEKTLYDPHTWLDPVLVADEAMMIAEQLATIDPDNKSYYMDNAANFKEKAEALDNKYSKRFEEVSERTFVTQHTAFAYVATRYHLTQLGIAGVDEAEPSPRQMAEVMEFVKENRVKTIFAEPQTSQKKADVIAQATGAEIKIIQPLEADPKNNKSYLDNLDDSLDLIASDLEARSK